jgi:hypothetical protein
LNATSIIGRIRTAGGDITLAEEGIRLKVPITLRDEVIAEIKAQKSAIRRALKNETDVPWDADDYRTFHHERADIAEIEGGQTRAQAEASAFDASIVEWLNRHPEPSDAGCCAWCKGQGQSGHCIVPFGADGRGHTWLHVECWVPWQQLRRQMASIALENDVGHCHTTLAPTEKVLGPRTVIDGEAEDD